MAEYGKNMEQLITLPQDELEKLGVLHTAREIYGEPAAWKETAKGLAGESKVYDSARSATSDGVVLCGAGSSDYIGRSIRSYLEQTLGIPVRVVSTTDIVTMEKDELAGQRASLYVSFARSGNSPESIATYDRISRYRSDARQLVITCNSDGALARRARSDESGADLVVLPEQTLDQGLAMTASFTSMVLAGLALAVDPSKPECSNIADSAAEAASRVFSSEVASELASLGASRACYLGSNDLAGLSHEAALKSLELTNGALAVWNGSYLALRHGPRVFVDDRCLVIAMVSDDAGIRRYERDLLSSLQEGRRPLRVVALGGENAITDVADMVDASVIMSGPAGEMIHPAARRLSDIVFAQVFALFLSLKHGLTPDNPSPDGAISPVVRGVTIYPDDE